VDDCEAQMQMLKSELMQQGMKLEKEVFTRELIEKEKKKIKMQEGTNKMEIKQLKLNLKDEKVKSESINSKYLNAKEEMTSLSQLIEKSKAEIEKKDKLVKMLQ